MSTGAQSEVVSKVEVKTSAFLFFRPNLTQMDGGCLLERSSDSESGEKRANKR